MKDSPSSIVKKDSLASIFKYLLLGFGITALLIIVTKLWIEHTTWGHRAEMFTFELLQGQLSPFNPEEKLPIVVVDISDIPLIDGKYKDREKLIEVISAIAEQKPSAIGVDIILSPEQGKWQTQADPQLLNLGLELTNKGVPIFFGVDSEMPLGKPAAWLGEERLKSLATTIAIYRKDAKRIPLWAKDKNQAEKLTSMSLALAEVEQKKHPEKVPSSRLPNWMVETIDGFSGRIEHDKDIEYADTLVNYSKLEAIQQTALLTISATSVKEFGRKFKDRIVILGSGTKEKASDNFIVPSRPEPIPGVYLHACAAYTLMREPVYEFKPIIRILLDVLLSALVLLIVAYNRWQHLNDKAGFDWHTLQHKLVWRGGFCITLFAIILVYVTSVLWLDFIFIVIALLLHPWLEKNLTLLWQRLKPNAHQSEEETV